MLLKRYVIAALAVLAVVTSLAPTPADAANCGSQSSVSRRCFFSVYKVCIDKKFKKAFCHARADACRTCADKIAKCRAQVKSTAQCGSCAKSYDACMRPVFKGITGFN